MDKIFASLERIKALWQQLARATPGAPEYDAIAKNIRAESDTYNALAATTSPPPKRKN